MIPKGTEITCPECGAHITTTMGDIVAGTVLGIKVMGLPEDWSLVPIGSCADIACKGLCITAKGMHTVTGWIR